MPSRPVSTSRSAAPTPSCPDQSAGACERRPDVDHVDQQRDHRLGLGRSPFGLGAGTTIIADVVTGDGLGTTSIYVNSTGLGGASAHVPINVQQGLTIVPSALIVPVGGAGQFILNMTYAQGGDVDVLIEWGGSGTGAVTVTDPGTATTYPNSPATVTIPGGQLTQTFEVNGINATITPFTMLATLPDTLPAGLAGAQATSQVTVTGSASSANLTLTPSPVIWYLPDATDPTLTVGMSPTQATNTLITLVSSIPGVGMPTNPSETITAGGSTVSFDVVGATVGTTNITASLPPSISGAPATAQVTFFDLAFSPTVLNLAPGGSGNIVMSTTTSIPAPIVVTLTNNAPGVFSIPATVTIPAGSSVSIPVTAVAPGTGDLNVTLPATSGGDTISAAASVTVSDVTLTLTPTPVSTYVGSATTMTATISAAQPTATIVTLNVVGGAPGNVTVPATVTVPSGATTADFTMTGAQVGTATVEGNLPPALNTTGPPDASASVTIADVPLAITPAARRCTAATP